MDERFPRHVWGDAGEGFGHQFEKMGVDNTATERFRSRNRSVESIIIELSNYIKYW